MNNTVFKKDLYITDVLRNKLIEFLVNKTGLEWYYFIKSGDITKNIKPYLLDFARCFSELSISFNNQIDFDTACSNCFETRGNYRITFIFTEKEYELFEVMYKKYNIKTKLDIFFILLTAIVNQNKKYSVNLEYFSKYFLEKGKATPIFIPKEIVNKLLKFGFKYKRTSFLRKAMFYQIHFGNTEIPNNPDYFTVTPNKTGWIRMTFWANQEIKDYVGKNTFGYNKSITLLIYINTYLDNLNG